MAFEHESDEIERWVAKRLFRQRFQQAVRRCIVQGFSVEECFGAAWELTTRQLHLDEADQAGLYAELIEWARSHKRQA